ncbi:membrane-bound PQQ-dependent dehydrogenase, glucose/quinate/shikimate family [Novosphingobium sp. AAP1]|uniref:membrane-bound PQQ-dependent dehydrogenase, glucose/quinate/shikimate family n=1 Tax=Novosphingobium sp. AAP1 TaxID=1523413 RepID=UPI000A849321|nr:membrane-bound PQQ-dependent dehydrogenase, glucose/quinate/shikimate family [Novosphingobium sp. AAP1]
MGKTSKLLAIMAIVLALCGMVLLGGGLWLAIEGGSWFYAPAGLALIACAVLLWRRQVAALHLYAALVVATLAWALVEIGLDWWALVPRGDVIFILGALLLLPWITRRLVPAQVGWWRNAGPLALTLILAGAIGLAAMLRSPHEWDGALPGARGAAPALAAGTDAGDWLAYGHTWAGTKWSPLAQLTPANVSGLKQVWRMDTGDSRRPGDPEEITYELTPIKVGDTLYACTPHNIVLALDAETGAVRWRYDPHMQVPSHVQHLTCRGVSYHDANWPGATRSADGSCPQRIIMATADARLIALDAHTGRLCPGFGKGGAVNLAVTGPGLKPGWFQFTSAPLVTRGLVVVGGAIYDNASIHMPSGAIQAFDIATGKPVWAFDPGRPEDTAPLGPNHPPVPSTPNSWSTAAADEDLGLIYLPMGMGAIDQWGGNRPPNTERFATSILALDIKTGKARWVFQTVHHDLWDMDVPAQPALVDLTIPGKGRVPALVQSTKTGNIFVLDRRTGLPIQPVHEMRVPGGAAHGDFTSPTQPVSAISLMPPRIREADMWGATLFDQMACRIAFRRYRHEGPFTPPSTRGTLVFPGNFGVMDWGGLAIDPVRQVAFAHPNYMAFVDRLIPQRPGAGNGKDGPAGASDRGGSAEHGFNPNAGAPFAVSMGPFLSRLGLPCQSPPWGYVAGIDLVTGKVAWRHANGTIRDETPLPIPLKLGVPSLGGPMMTGGGLSFMAASLDYYLRAYDTTTGRVLWRARLPAGAQATPMTYRSPASGRQFVVVVAGGHGSLGTRLGDSIIAYALPKS